MKLRLLENIVCPTHPEEYLQLRKGHIARLFDIDADVPVPLCLYYCGLAQGKLEDLPGEIIPPCKECMSLDVQWGLLRCPKCGGYYALYDGIPVLTKLFPEGTEAIAEKAIAEVEFEGSRIRSYRRRGPFAKSADKSEIAFVMHSLGDEPVNMALYLGSAASGIIDEFCSRDASVVVASEEPQELIRIREQDMINPCRRLYFLVTGPDLAGIRSGIFDLIISGHRLYGPKGYIPPSTENLPRLCHRSGIIALILYADSIAKRFLALGEGDCGRMNENRQSTRGFREGLPEEITAMKAEAHSSGLFEMLLLRHRTVEVEDIRTAFRGDDAEAMINA